MDIVFHVSSINLVESSISSKAANALEVLTTLRSLVGSLEVDTTLVEVFATFTISFFCCLDVDAFCVIFSRRRLGILRSNRSILKFVHLITLNFLVLPHLCFTRVNLSLDSFLGTPYLLLPTPFTTRFGAALGQSSLE
jgi:hypothetical protein